MPTTGRTVGLSSQRVQFFDFIIFAFVALPIAWSTHRAADSEEETQSKWMVVTTMNHHIGSIIDLATVSGLKVVVVVDKEIPPDWQFHNVDIIDLKRQENLRYGVLPLIPSNHIGRKNIGYLWAIENGATQIYEFNDLDTRKIDAIPSLSQLRFYTYNTTGTLVCNPYGFFGHPQVWPRGYPLEHIQGQPACTSFARQVSSQPLILQGLANVDPDVDAIYRLTQPLNIMFNHNSPSVVLPKGIMAPFSSQNTLFASEALWSLMLPVTTTSSVLAISTNERKEDHSETFVIMVFDRVSDIWRGYWAQRLLWEVGAHVAFGPPSLKQMHNKHSTMTHLGEEISMYQRAGELVMLLNNWHATPGHGLAELMVELAQVMAVNSFWGQVDVDLTRAWVADLKAIGYSFPQVHEPSGNAVNTHKAMALVTTPAMWYRYDAIVLVIMFNNPHPAFKSVYETLKTAYTPLFRRIVYTGYTRPNELPAHELWVQCESHMGGYQQMCFANVVQEVRARPDGGYLFIGDDTLFSHCQISAFNVSKVWFQRAVSAKKEEDLHDFVDRLKARGTVAWAWTHETIDAYTKVLKGFTEDHTKNKFGNRVQAKLGDDLSKVHFGGDNTDAIYIPSRLAFDFALGIVIFSSQPLFHEVVIPAVLGIITEGPDDFEVFKGLYYWDGGRDAVAQNPKHFLTEDGLVGHAFMLHPYKLSSIEAQKTFLEWWQASSCLTAPTFDQSWNGTIGFGVGEDSPTIEDETHLFRNFECILKWRGRHLLSPSVNVHKGVQMECVWRPVTDMISYLKPPPHPLDAGKLIGFA